MKKISRILCLLVLISLFSSLAMADGQVTIRVKPGFNGAYKENSLVALQIIVDNPGPAIEGKLVLKNDDKNVRQHNSFPNYAMEINVPQGESKSFEMLVPGEIVTAINKVELINEKSLLTSVPLQGLRVGEAILILDISKDGNVTGNLAGALQKSDYMQGATAIALEVGDLPQDLIAWQGANLMVIDGNTFQEIEDSQRKKLQDWVQLGGNLIISNTKDIKGKLLYGSQENPLIYGERKGLGFIVSTTFDMFTGSGLEKNQEEEIWQQLILNQQPNFHWFNYHRYMDAVNIFEEIKAPSLRLYGLIFIGYILLIGPILYFIFRRLDKRDLTWIAIPLVALTLTIGIIGIGNARVSGDGLFQTMSTITIVDENLAYLEGGAGAVIPKGGSYSFQTADNAYGIPINRGGMSMRNINVNQLANGQKTIDFSRVEQWSIRNLGYKSIINNLGTISGNLALANNVLKGELVNNTGLDLTDVIIETGPKTFSYGNWPKGGTLKIEETMDWDSKNTWSEWRDSSHSYQQNLNQSRQRLLNIHMDAPYTYEKEYRTDTKASYSGDVLQTLPSQKLDGWEVTVKAWSDTDFEMISIPELEVAHKSDNLIQQGVAVNLGRDNGFFYPWGLIKPSYTGNVEYDYSNRGEPGMTIPLLVLDQKLQVDFEVGKDLIVEAIYNNFADLKTPSINTAILNHQTGSWDLVKDLNLGKISSEKAAAYLSDKGILSVSYQNETGTRQFIFEPAIQVLGRYK